MMHETYTTKFPIHLPSTEGVPARLVDEIEVEVYIDEDGDEVLTSESSILIEEVRARHQGLMTGRSIKEMRKRLDLTQDALSELLSCGKKSLSRWENGKGYPSGIVNKILRLLDEGFVAPTSLKAVSGPRLSDSCWVDQLASKYAKPDERKIYRYDFWKAEHAQTMPVHEESLALVSSS